MNPEGVLFLIVSLNGEIKKRRMTGKQSFHNDNERYLLLNKCFVTGTPYNISS
jgi:hypothetical protein